MPAVLRAGRRQRPGQPRHTGGPRRRRVHRQRTEDLDERRSHREATESSSPARIPSAPKHKGISYFVCPMDLPGIEVRPIIEMTGAHVFNEVFFTDVRLPAENLVGDLHDGWRLAKVTLGNERVSLSTGGVLWGGGPTALELLDAVRAGGAVADPTMRQRLASVYIEHTLLELIRMRTLTARLKGEAPGPEASIRKLMGDEHGQHVMLLARDLIGAAALLTGPDAPADRRPARIGLAIARSAGGGRPRRSQLALRVPVLAGADDRWRHRRRAAQHHRRTSARPAPRCRRPAGPVVVGGPARRDGEALNLGRCDGCQLPFARMGINTFADILRTHAAERPEAVSLALGEREVTWAELYERSRRVAAGLRRRRRRRRRTGSRSSTRTASSTSRWRTAPRSATPSRSTSTGGSPRPRWRTSCRTAGPRSSSSGPTSCPVLDAIAADLADDVLVLVIAGPAAPGTATRTTTPGSAAHDAADPARRAAAR